MLTLSPITLKETERIWQLRNDVATRREFGTPVISYAQCLDWVANVANGKTEEYVFLVKDDKLGNVGLVILEKHGTEMEIHVTIDHAHRVRRGYGKQAIKLATDWAMMNGADRVVANIREENYKGLFAFESSGYKEVKNYLGPKNISYFEYETRNVNKI